MNRPDGNAFTIEAQDACGARAGRLLTAHGAVETPVFMPVATQGTIKALTQEDLERLGCRAILANSYHLYLRPGVSIVEKAGGLHRFMNYDGAILTDSGGFQVMSLAPLCELSDEGAKFKSHVDGSMHFFRPEDVIEIQSKLGSDMWTTLDECVRYPCDETAAKRALERTMQWTDRSVAAFKTNSRSRQALFFPIVQGSFFPALRRQAAEHLSGLEFDGVSLGGFSVGEPKDLTWSTLERTLGHLPAAKPRYLMGVGTPEDLWDATALGVDMMDCVWPTRVARHGMAMTSAGRLNLMSSSPREDFLPMDERCSCWVCKNHGRAYLSHLYRSSELVVHRLVSYHNVHFLLEIMRLIRRSIIEGRFKEARAEFFARYKTKTPA